MIVACLSAGTGTLCLASKMARHTVPFAGAGALQDLSVPLFEPFLKLPQLR